MVESGLIVLCSFISPYRAEREMVRRLVGEREFIEVFVDSPIEDCMQRDPKGLYAKAKAGSSRTSLASTHLMRHQIARKFICGQRTSSRMTLRPLSLTISWSEKSYLSDGRFDEILSRYPVSFHNEKLRGTTYSPEGASMMRRIQRRAGRVLSQSRKTAEN